MTSPSASPSNHSTTAATGLRPLAGGPAQSALSPAASRRPSSAETETRRWGALGLATLASVALASVRLESAPTGFSVLAGTGVSLLGAWGVWLWLQRGSRHRDRFVAALPLTLTLWTAWPLVAEVVVRSQAYGEAVELLMLVCFQNATLWMAAHAERPATQQRVAAMSAFLTLFAFIISSSAPVAFAASLFGVGFLWWLMVRYWERVQRIQLNHSRQRCLPVRGTALGLIVVVGLIIVWIAGPLGPEGARFAGWLPTSGGDRWSDADARSGVGNGDAVVAAIDEAMSFGPVDSDVFLESHEPSLYDMFSDLYGDPPKPKKDFERAISLGGSTQPKEQHLNKSQHASRNFATVRQPRKRRREEFADRTHAAMLYVLGQTPLHLALERFDSFDGRDWEHSGEQEPTLVLTLSDQVEQPWLRILRPDPIGWLQASRRHSVKLINFKSPRIPSPPQLSGVHIDRVDRRDFYGWTTDGSLCMPVRESIPKLTVLQIRSQAINLNPFREMDFTADLPWQSGPHEPLSETAKALRARGAPEHTVSHALERYVAVPQGASEQAQRLAASWTRGVPRGWLQVEAITRQLRRRCQLDRETTPPLDCQSPIDHFLEVQRGPDYLFASTAAVMLRSLGYPTRLVTGFYARPDRFDPRSGHTVVAADDVHAWLEVCVDERQWVTVEPSPGYFAPYESLTFWQACRKWMLAAYRAARRHVWLIAALAGGLLGVSVTRRLWMELAYRLWFYLTAWGSPQRQIHATLKLMERQANLRGIPRPSSQPVSQWILDRLRTSRSTPESSTNEFIRTTERILYGPSRSVSLSNSVTLRAICREARRHFRASLTARSTASPVESPSSPSPTQGLTHTTVSARKAAA